MVYVLIYWIIWLRWVGKMNQMLRCDWLSKSARGRLGLRAVSLKENLFFLFVLEIDQVIFPW